MLFTKTLKLFSIKYRAQECFIIIVILHDFNDIFLENAKLFYSLREQNGKINILFKNVVTICFILLPITWFITRIYLYPIYGIQRSFVYPNYSFVTLLTVFALLIYLMDLIWFAVSYSLFN